jgi:hypothetical protein
MALEVVKTEKVDESMDREIDKLGLEAVPEFVSLPPGLRDGDDDVSEVPPAAVPQAFQGKGKDVRCFIFFPVGSVERPHGGVAGEDERDVGVFQTGSPEQPFDQTGETINPDSALRLSVDDFDHD